MPVLDAALAFALTMLVVATVVTQIVRFLRNTAELRSAELKKMLKEFFDRELQPVVQRELNRMKKKIGDKVASELVETTKNLNWAGLFDQNQLAKDIEVSTEELTERLKRSTLGQKLLTELGDQAQAVFNELGRRYEVVGDRFSESFRKYSWYWSTGVALVLAVVFNIDSVHIMDSYLRNEGMRQDVIAQRDAFVQDYNALTESLEKEQGKSVTKEELEQAFNDSREQLDVLTTVGFPVGWSYFPHSGFYEEGSKDFERRNNFGGWVAWIVGIVLTAGLAGLGAPFWYDAVTGISRIAQRARAVNKPAAGPQQYAPAFPAPPAGTLHGGDEEPS